MASQQRINQLQGNYQLKSQSFGVTLIELMICLSIAAILAGVAAASWSRYQSKQTVNTWSKNIKEAVGSAVFSLRRNGQPYEFIMQYNHSTDKWCTAAVVAGKNCNCLNNNKSVCVPRSLEEFSNSKVFQMSGEKSNYRISIYDLVRVGANQTQELLDEKFYLSNGKKATNGPITDQIRLKINSTGYTEICRIGADGLGRGIPVC
jgi:prepilin-type N-terminal cleavage/methylation domain-containing protein